MSAENARPAPIPAYAQGTFAHFTIQRRLPKILGDVTAQLDDRTRADPRWVALGSGIASGGEIDVNLFSADTPFWRRERARLSGARWSQQSFFQLEFLFYHAINSIAADLRPGLDVFASTRRTALAEALPQVARTIESANALSLSLDAVLLLAAYGNEADLSQLDRESGREAAGATAPGSLLLDHRPRIIERLGRLGATSGRAVVHILADNAGSELCFDLVLVDALLQAGCASIAMHLKPRPMFVSDALISDAEETLSGFSGQGQARKLTAIADRLTQAVQEGSLVFRASPDWAEPRHMGALEPEVSAALRSATLVLAKGDLNYRRFFEDRSWPAETPVEVASVAGGIHAFGLRVLKSDCVVGLEAPQVATLFREDADWRSNAKHCLIQQIGQ